MVLVGLPGSGKSTVGRLVADRLGAPFVDVDAMIERREGRPIAAIFGQQGEQAFREMERRAMQTALAGDAAVLAPGGGWAAEPGALDEARASALVIYLRARAETATRRAEPGNRPLLMEGDAGDRMRDLLQQREGAYLAADATVDTDNRSVDAVAEEVVRLARAGAGW